MRAICQEVHVRAGELWLWLGLGLGLGPVKLCGHLLVGCVAGSVSGEKKSALAGEALAGADG